MKKLCVVFLVCLFILPLQLVLADSDVANEHSTTWSAWLEQVRQEALDQGISPQLLDEAFKGIKPNRRVVRLDRTQPERRLTFMEYRNTRIDPYRIKLGRREFRKKHALLEAVGKEYGVDPCFITAFWGLETSYGRYLGSFPVIKSLATLAFDGRRSAFFRRELFLALHILNDGHIELSKFKGEWAGASGHPQFLPSSWKKFAVDYDQDGRKDIWNNYGDVFASIANYLVLNGWQTGEPWGYEVTLPADFDTTLFGLKIKKSLAEWQVLGVRRVDGDALPAENLVGSVITLHGGTNFLVFKNFSVIRRYNPSKFYAASIGYLAEQICQRH